MKRYTLIMKIVKVAYEIADSIIDDIEAAKSKNSDGGKEITPKERRKIVFDNVTEAVPKIFDIVKDF